METTNWRQLCGLGGALSVAGAGTYVVGLLPIWAAGGLIGFGGVLLAAGLARREVSKRG